MAAVRVMQVVVYQVVHVVPVWNLRMPAGRTVHVIVAVLAARMLRGAAGRVRRADREHVVVQMVAVDMV